jgi:hypothetical protein
MWRRALRLKRLLSLRLACADLKREKESIAAGYRRLSEKAFIEKTEQEKMELVEIHATELASLRGDLDLKTRSYMEYRQNVWHQLRELHETVASSFEEVKAQCFPFPGKAAKIEEMIDWVDREVKTMLDTVWQLNDNFTILGIEGILNILNAERC